MSRIPCVTKILIALALITLDWGTVDASAGTAAFEPPFGGPNLWSNDDEAAALLKDSSSSEGDPVADSCCCRAFYFLMEAMASPSRLDVFVEDQSQQTTEPKGKTFKKRTWGAPQSLAKYDPSFLGYPDSIRSFFEDFNYVDSVADGNCAIYALAYALLEKFAYARADDRPEEVRFKIMELWDHYSSKEGMNENPRFKDIAKKVGDTFQEICPGNLECQQQAICASEAPLVAFLRTVIKQSLDEQNIEVSDSDDPSKNNIFVNAGHLAVFLNHLGLSDLRVLAELSTRRQNRDNLRWIEGMTHNSEGGFWQPTLKDLVGRKPAFVLFYHFLPRGGGDGGDGHYGVLVRKTSR